MPLMTTWLQCDCVCMYMCVFLHVGVTSLKEFVGAHKHTYTRHIYETLCSSEWV